MCSPGPGCSSSRCQREMLAAAAASSEPGKASAFSKGFASAPYQADASTAQGIFLSCDVEGGVVEIRQSHDTWRDMSKDPKPFRLQIPDSAIADLRERLSRTRFPDEPPLKPWSTGTSLAYMKDLIPYWQSDFQWRKWEEKLNSFRQFTVPIGGIDL